jgi:hypothetical protein
MKKEGTVTIDLKTKEAATHFTRWLCGQGEQDYWIWMECREQEEEGDITAVRFNYDYENAVISGEMGRTTA